MRLHAIPILRLAVPLAVLLPAPAAPAARAQGSAQGSAQRVDTAFTFDASGTVQLSIVSGLIRVTGSRSNEVRIVASVERGRLETSFSRSRVSIEARSVGNRLGEARYVLTVPVGTRVRATSVSGDVTIRATEGEVQVRTVSGNAHVEDATSLVDVSTVSGDVGLKRVRARLRLESVSGDFSADSVAGDLSLETVSGSVTLRRSQLDGIRAQSVSGDLRYEGPFAARGVYRFSAHSGSVGIALPADAGAVLELETFSGRIDSDFPLTLQPGGAVGRRNRRMEFTVGSGGPRITAETFSGNITIRRLPARGREN